MLSRLDVIKSEKKKKPVLSKNNHDATFEPSVFCPKAFNQDGVTMQKFRGIYPKI